MKLSLNHLRSGIALFSFFAVSALWAGGSKAPGNGSFEDLSSVSANGAFELVLDKKDGKLAPMATPKRVAFTQVKDRETDVKDTFMLLRNNKGKNFRFELPDTIQVGSLDRPYSYDAATRLAEEGDVLEILPGDEGTGQELGLRLIFDNEYDNSYSYDTTESCSVRRVRHRRVRECHYDDHGHRHCRWYYVEEVYYEYGRRDVTRHVSDYGYTYQLELFDRTGQEQMRGRVLYSESSSYTSSRGPCYLH